MAYARAASGSRKTCCSSRNRKTQDIPRLTRSHAHTCDGFTKQSPKKRRAGAQDPQRILKAVGEGVLPPYDWSIPAPHSPTSLPLSCRLLQDLHPSAQCTSYLAIPSTRWERDAGGTRKEERQGERSEAGRHFGESRGNPERRSRSLCVPQGENLGAQGRIKAFQKRSFLTVKCSDEGIKIAQPLILARVLSTRSRG